MHVSTLWSHARLLPPSRPSVRSTRRSPSPRKGGQPGNGRRCMADGASMADNAASAMLADRKKGLGQARTLGAPCSFRTACCVDRAACPSTLRSAASSLSSSLMVHHRNAQAGAGAMRTRAPSRPSAKSLFFGYVCDLTPKARKTFFTEVLSQRACFFGIPPAPEYLCGPYFKTIARPDHGNPAVPGPRQSTRLGSRSSEAAAVP